MNRTNKRSTMPQGDLPTASANDLVWLLSFADKGGQLATLSGNELEAWRSRIWSFSLRTMTHGDPEELSARRIAQLANEIGHGIRALLRGEPWRPRIGPLTLYLDLKNGQPHAQYIAHHRDGFLLQAYEVIAAEGRRLRRCQRAECRKPFVAIKRQVFCGASCAQQERKQRFVDRHGSRELSERRHRRYVELVRLKQGAAVAKKVRRRGLIASNAGSTSGHTQSLESQ